MLLGKYYNGIEIHREAKIVYAKFLSPHRVISTDRIDGGLSEKFTYLYNHQLCEPSGHDHQHDLALHDPVEYRRIVCEPFGLPPEQCASLGTAANINNLAMCHASYRDLELVAACTAGVEVNAARAGDPATFYECDGSFEAIAEEGGSTSEAEKPGTINTMIFINSELTPGAMVRAVITATEAKTAVLQELAVHSRLSGRLATGTGTDQVGIACKLGGDHPLTSAGEHTKLGELIGKTVHDTIKQALLLQNNLTPGVQRSSSVYIARLGVDEDSFCAGIEAYLDESEADLLRKNFQAVDQDPMTTAAVASLVYLRDKFLWGLLPESCMPEILSSYGAQVAAAVSGTYDHIAQYRKNLSNSKKSIDSELFMDLIYRSFALGFAEKWS